MRQRISLLAACGLVAVGLTTPTAMAAESADPVFRLAGQSDLALRPHPETGSPQPVAVSFRLADTGAFAGEFTFTVDRAAVAGIASVKETPGAPQKCVEDGTKLVCKDKGPRPGVDLVATAEKGAKEGAKGAVKVTGTAAGATVTGAETTLTIGGPDLVMRKLALKTDPKPGESQTLPLAFSNEGTQPAKGVILELEATRGLELPERYDNCAYRTDRTSNTVVCTVEGDFEAKATYELAGDSPLHLKAGANALNERFAYGIYPAAAPQKATDAKAPDAKKPDTAGSATTAGRKLVARKKAEAAPAPLRAPDLNEADNKRTADLTVDNTADFAAEDLTVKGAAGATVKAVVAARNNGPAWVTGTGNGPAALVDVVFPKGVKVLTAPAACREVRAAQYRCATGTSVLEKEKLEFPFEVKIEKAVKDAKGAVTVGTLDAKGDLTRHAFDKVLTNNQAAFTANPTATSTTSPTNTPPTTIPPTSPSPTASGSTGSTTGNNASGAAGRSNGPLASTGSTAGLVGIAAVGLFAVGAALYLSFRRRNGGGAHA
ncbi:hypothetical protein ACIPW5_21035 [Streptomyces sp. NPDC090077]|uniref:hypothetical protein n=1 Tax=Streptomyces sp. NPDC090077 TaxID=3365938 RepID=UPI0038209D00